jgi:hypothetical protein
VTYNGRHAGDRHHRRSGPKPLGGQRREKTFEAVEKCRHSARPKPDSLGQVAGANVSIPVSADVYPEKQSNQQGEWNRPY